MFFLVPSSVIAAGVPTTLSFQGRLSDASGNLLGGSGTSYFFKFSIWDNPTVGNGSRLWPASAPGTFSTQVKSGVFNVNIGDVANGYPDALNYNFNTNSTVYLQVEVSSDGVTFQTLAPRQLVTAAAFAQIAGAVSGTGQSSFGTTTPVGSSIVSVMPTSTNTIGETIRAVAGQVADLFDIQNSAGNNLFSVAANGSTTIGNLGSGLVFANASGTLASLPTGTSGMFLEASSTSPSGFAWAFASTSGVGSVAWGAITGNITDQTDLANALNAKLSTTSAAATYVSFPYASSTFPTFAYASSTFMPLASSSLFYPASNPSGFISLSSASSSFVSFPYASSTFYPASNPAGYIVSGALTPYTTLSYASATFATYSFLAGNYPNFAYGSSTYQLKVSNPVTGTGTPQGIAYFTATGTIASLATGTSGMFLEASSTSPSGYDWAFASSSSATVSWGAITGTLSSQTDLQNALNALVPYGYASTTFGNFAYNSSTFATIANYPTYAYASTTFARASTTVVGGSVVGGTPGGIMFVNASGNLAQDPSNFNYDPTTQKLTVHGGIDPIFFLASDASGSAAYYEAAAGQNAATSGTSTGRIRYNATAKQLEMSAAGGAYVAIGTLSGTSTAGFVPYWTGTTTLATSSLYYATSTGFIGIGTTTPGTALSVAGTTTTNGLTISNLANAVLAVDAAGNVVATTSVSGGGVSNTYASSTFATYTYATNTFSTYGYNTSTFPTFSYASNTFATIAGTVTNTYASSTFVNYGYATNTFLTIANAASTYVPFTYATNTFATYTYATNTFSTYGYNTSTFPTFAYATSTYQPMTNLGDTIYGGTGGVATVLPGNTDTVQKFLSQTGDGVNSAAPSWQVFPTQSTLAYYMQNTTSDISGYWEQLVVPQVGKTTFSTAGLATGTTTLRIWATDPGFPGLSFIPAGQFGFHVHAARTAGNRTANVFAEIWEVSATGTDIAKIGTTESTAIDGGLTGTETQYDLYFALPTTYVMQSTSSRLATKVFAVTSGGGTAPTVTLYYGDGADTRTTLPTNAANATNFVPYSGATSDLNLGAHNFSVDNNTLFVNATNNRVGIGTTSPSSALGVVGTTTTSGLTIANLSGSLLAVDSSGNVISTTTASALTGYVTNTYASSTFPSFTYASNTFATIANYPTYTYASSTFPTFAYGTSTYLSQVSAASTYVPFTYSSSTFPSFSYASSAYALAGNTPTFSYASSTFVNFGYASSTFQPIGSYVTNSYASSTFPSFTYASATYATSAALANYVPYTGATTNVNLGNNQLTVSGTSTLATTTISNLTLGNATNSILATDVNGKVIATSTASFLAGFVTNSYASSTFPSFTYASSTFASTSFVVNNFPTFTYASNTFATVAGTVTNSYASSTFVNFTYATNTFLTIANAASTYQPIGSYVTNTYASSTFPTFTYATSTFVPFGYATNTFATYTYATNTFSTYGYNTSTFPTFAYASSTFASTSFVTGNYVPYTGATSDV
ncbi:MAG: hypothetical protein KGH93_03260, partial [Patescibacteria group bacterium]|nr:hypothetical protein [Patescibacteria group bacterium]